MLKVLISGICSALCAVCLHLGVDIILAFGHNCTSV